MEKSGLSPVIATILLISMAVVLSGIIFVWARSFLDEKVTKFDEPIENACGAINFNAESYDSKIHILNSGNVPLLGFEIRKKTASSLVKAETLESTVSTGETASVDVPSSLEAGDEVILVPVIIGKSGAKKGRYVCDESYGMPLVI